MDKKSLIIISAAVLVASFIGSLLGAYLVEKTGTQTLPQMQGGAPSQGIPPQGGFQQGQQLCGDGTCDAFEKQNNVCPEDCRK
jgi:hypothetical protein